MCVMSMVHDHYAPLIPDLTKPFFHTPMPPTPPITPAQATDWARIAEEFRKAVAAARVVDELTKQPDCVDPEKAKLEERVTLLEKRLAELEASQKPRKSAKKARKLSVSRETIRVKSGVKAGLCAGGDYSTTPDRSVMDPEFP